MSRRRLFLFPIIIWVGVIAAHFLVSILSFHWSLLFAFIDSLIHNLVLFVSIFGLYWLNKYFHETFKNRVWNLLTFVFSFFISVSFWYLLRDALFTNILLPLAGNDKEFLQQSEFPRLIIAILELLIGAGFLYMLNKIDEIRNLTEREASLKETLRQTQLNALKWQINPHFLFNALNSISSLTIISPQKAHEMILKLGELLRYSLKSDLSGLITVKEELYLLSLYTDIEKIRFGNRLRLMIEVDDSAESLKIPSMLLQPLIENAVKHGVNSSEDGADIFLSISNRLTHLLVVVQNKYDKAGRRIGSKTGLANIADRLTIIFGTPKLLSIRDSGSEFFVEVIIPLS